MRRKNRAEQLAVRRLAGLCIVVIGCTQPVLADKFYCARPRSTFASGFQSGLHTHVDNLPAEICEEICTALRGFVLPPRYGPIRASNLQQLSINCEFATGDSKRGLSSFLCSVAIIDAKTKTVLLNCRVDHGKSGKELLRQHYDEKPDKLNIHWQIKRCQILQYYCKTKHHLELLSAEQIFRTLDTIGFKDAVVWDWSAKGDLDTSLLQTYLKQFSLDTSKVIPPPSRRLSACRLIAHDLRKYFNAEHMKQIKSRVGVPGLTIFSLERLFSVFEPTDPRCLNHHEAEIDASKNADVTQHIHDLLLEA